MAAYVLTRAGIKTLILEAGRNYDPVTEAPMFQWNYQAPLLGNSTPDKHFGYYDATVNGGWEVPGEPYTNAPGSIFRWWRSRMLGGRTNHWGRHVPRFGPYDFKAFSRDGLGTDWPISYADIAPWYDRTEKLIGVSGTNNGLENHPDSSPDVLLPPSKPRITELAIRAAAEDLGIPCVPARQAVLTRAMPHPHAPRQACFNATSCGHGQTAHAHRCHGIADRERCARSRQRRGIFRQNRRYDPLRQGPSCDPGGERLRDRAAAA
jgi:choline dehydrogenase-like flavoprotein